MSDETPIPTFSERCQREVTRDVVFLFQMRRWIHNGVPEGYDTDGESIWKRPDNDNEDAPEHLKWSDIDKMENDDGMPYRIERWDTEGVWLSREEAEAFGKAKHYNYPDGYRVYGVPSNGRMAELIRAPVDTAPLEAAARAALNLPALTVCRSVARNEENKTAERHYDDAIEKILAQLSAALEQKVTT